MSIPQYLQASQAVLESCVGYPGVQRVEEAVDVVVKALLAHKLIVVWGDAGSAADAAHIVDRMMSRIAVDGRSPSCICLPTEGPGQAKGEGGSPNSVLIRQLEVHAVDGGVLLGIAGSSGAQTMVPAFAAAKTRNMKTIAFAGYRGGQVAEFTDILIDVPSNSTAMIQQAHICLCHYFCQEIEAKIAGPDGAALLQKDT